MKNGRMELGGLAETGIIDTTYVDLPGGIVVSVDEDRTVKMRDKLLLLRAADPRLNEAIRAETPEFLEPILASELPDGIPEGLILAQRRRTYGEEHRSL